MKNILVLFLALVLSGCMGCSPPSMIAHQEDATELVWRGVYGVPRDKAPPDIYWIEQADLNCAPDENGVFQGFYRDKASYEVNLQCVGGVLWTPSWYAQIAHHQPFVFSESSFAHELYHAFLSLHGSPDPTHSGPGWKPGGILEKANEALEASGFDQ